MSTSCVIMDILKILPFFSNYQSHTRSILKSGKVQESKMNKIKMTCQVKGKFDSM